MSEFCSLAKNNGRWCLRSERSWETGGNGRWPTWGRNAMQAVALHWPQRGAHPPNITYCPTILRQNHQNTSYWKYREEDNILPLSGLNVVPMHPPNITHSPPPARFQQLCDEYLSLNICRWVLDMFWHPIFWNPLQPSWYNYDFWGQYFCTLCKRCQAHIRMTSRCPAFSLQQCLIFFSVGLCKSVGLLCIF